MFLSLSSPPFTQIRVFWPSYHPNSLDLARTLTLCHAIIFALQENLRDNKYCVALALAETKNTHTGPLQRWQEESYVKSCIPVHAPPLSSQVHSMQLCAREQWVFALCTILRQCPIQTFTAQYAIYTDHCYIGYLHLGLRHRIGPTWNSGNVKSEERRTTHQGRSCRIIIPVIPHPPLLLFCFNKPITR